MGRKRKLNWTHKKKKNRKQQKESKGVGWSQLPPDLLGLILKRLIIQDYLRFSRVCKLWRSITIEKPHHIAPQLPWLMLQQQCDSKYDYTFCSFPEDMRVLTIRRTEKCGGRGCCGSSDDWLVMVDYDSLKMSLLNPLSKAEIQLPHQSSMLQPSCEDSGQKRLIKTAHYIKKIIMFESHNSNNLIVAICRYSRYIAFCKVGDERWTALENQSLDYYGFKENGLLEMYGDDDVQHYNDIKFYNGKLYASTLRTIDVYNIDGDTCDHPKRLYRIPVPQKDHPWMGRIRFPQMDYQTGNRWQFVEFGGDLLMVLRESVDYKTLGFRVVKLEVDGSRARWVKVRSLGNDQVLFLSIDNLLCFSTRDFPVLEGNSIYFTQNFADDYDVGIYSMQDRTIKTFKSHMRARDPPTWFVLKP